MVELTTGLPGLDRVLRGVMPGDNIVWQVDSVGDYLALVSPYTEAALREDRRLVYFRFASHERLIGERPGVEIHRPDPKLGFESFVGQVHRVIEMPGKGRSMSSTAFPSWRRSGRRTRCWAIFSCSPAPGSSIWRP